MERFCIQLATYTFSINAQITRSRQLNVSCKKVPQPKNVVSIVEVSVPARARELHYELLKLKFTLSGCKTSKALLLLRANLSCFRHTHAHTHTRTHTRTHTQRCIYATLSIDSRSHRRARACSCTSSAHIARGCLCGCGGLWWRIW